MSQTSQVICPICNNNHLILKYQATYEYSYVIDSNAPGINNTEELLPHLYDNREQKDTKQFIECSSCGTNYPCYFDKWTERINTETIQKAIQSAYQANQHLSTNS